MDKMILDIIAVDHRCAQAVKDAGLRLDIQAPTTQMPSITAAIDTYLKSSNKKK